LSDIPIYNKPLPHLASHPIFSGSVAILTGENPKYPSTGDNNTLQQELKYHGYQFEPVKGQYGGTPENSFLVKNPDPKFIANLGKKYGQESILIGNNGKHNLLYTNGPNEGKYHPGTGEYGFHPTQKPEDNWTHFPGVGYLRLGFDFDSLHPLENNNMATTKPQVSQINSELATSSDVRKAIGDLGKSLRVVLAKHEEAIKTLGQKEAKGVQKLSKNAQENGGQLPGNVYNNPGVVTKAEKGSKLADYKEKNAEAIATSKAKHSPLVTKAMLGAGSIAGPAPQSGQMGAMGKAALSDKGKLDVASKEEEGKRLANKAKGAQKFYDQREWEPKVGKGASKYVYTRDKRAKLNAQSQSKAQEVEKNELPGAGTGVRSDDAGAYNQSMKMAEKGSKVNVTKKAEACPTCSSTKTSPMQGGKGSSEHLKCNDCSRLFRGAGNKDIKKSSEFTPECEGMGCQACGGNRIEHLGDLGARSHFICKSCGMSFSSPRQENEQALNDQDLEPINKSVHQAICSKCGAEQERQGIGRTLSQIKCNKCGEQALKDNAAPKKKYQPSSSGPIGDTKKSEKVVAGVKLSKSLGDIRKSAGRLPDGSGFFTGTVGKKVEKKEIPQVEPATDEIDMPGTKTLNGLKPKLIETDGSGSPTKGPDLKKVGIAPNVSKPFSPGAKAKADAAKDSKKVTKKEISPQKFAQHKPNGSNDVALLKYPKNSGKEIKGMLGKDSMDPGSTSNEIQKAGVFLPNPNAGSSVANYKVKPASELPISRQIPMEHKTAFLKGLIAKYGAHSVDLSQFEKDNPVKSQQVTKAEYDHKKAINGPCPTCGSRYAGDYCKECRHPRLAEGLRSQVAEKDRKVAHTENKANWEKKVNKAELGGVPKAPSTGVVKAPTANTVKAPGVKQANPTAPKTVGIKASTTPKV